MPYKVIKRSTDGLMSVFVKGVASGDAPVVRYRPGEWAEAPIGGLLCFGSLSSALLWLHDDAAPPVPGGPVEVWEVETGDPVSLPKFRALLNERRDMEAVWAGMQPPSGFVGRWDEGVVAYRKVRLVRRVLPGQQGEIVWEGRSRNEALLRMEGGGFAFRLYRWNERGAEPEVTLVRLAEPLGHRLVLPAEMTRYCFANLTPAELLELSMYVEFEPPGGFLIS